MANWQFWRRRAPSNDTGESPTRAPARIVDRHAALRDHVGEIAAAWDVWSEAQHEVRRLVRTAEWSGDLPDAGQRHALQQQFNAQIFEAYARARHQCAIVLAIDGVNMVASFDEHWSETWGSVTLTKAAAAYEERIALARERQIQARAAAAVQGAALEAAGVRT